MLWLTDFPASEAWFHHPGVSDHCKILITVLPAVSVRRPFKFFSFWMSHGTFKELLVTSWTAPVHCHSHLLKLSLKLKRLKPVLRQLNKAHYSNISLRVEEARSKLHQIQEDYFSHPHDPILSEAEKMALSQVMVLSLAEEGFKKQKSRVKWLALGDQNTRFFHQKLSTHNLRSKILSLVSTTGVRLEDPKEIQEEILGYYKGLLGSPFTPSVPTTEVGQALRTRVPIDMRSALIQPVSELEIKRAMDAIKGDKAPGPDGFCADFYHKNWDIVGPDVVQAVTQFFEKGYMLREWNSTAISLAPKTNAPVSIKDFRPITCCNVTYKCITKILVTRLQPLLPVLISPNQSAFIKGRSIVDNILLMQEKVKDYHKNQGSPRCALKIDIQKAYDSVAWEFLFDVMEGMEFPGLFISWVKQCVSTAMFSIVINGELIGYFPGKRGLRQGDPLSPCFFLSWKVFPLCFSEELISEGFLIILNAETFSFLMSSLLMTSSL